MRIGPIPSWGNCAHNVSESAHPELWPGLRVMWVPGLGSTGTYLRPVTGDHSGYAMLGYGSFQHAAGDAWKTERLGPCWYFDGSDDGITIPAVNSLRVSYISVMAWVHRTSSNTGQYIYNHYNRFGNAVILRKWYASIQFRIEVSGDNNAAYADADTYCPVGSWHLVGGTFDGSYVRLYSDARLIDEQPLSGAILNWYDKLSYIGTLSSSSVWGGYIGTMMMWDRAIDTSLMRTLLADPFAAVRRRRRVFGFVPAAGEGRTTHNTRAYPLGIAHGESRVMVA